MWIKTTDERVSAVGPPILPETVEFSDAGVAQVTKDVGEQAIAHYDFIINHHDD